VFLNRDCKQEPEADLYGGGPSRLAAVTDNDVKFYIIFLKILQVFGDGYLTVYRIDHEEVGTGFKSFTR
jgi:hypothetical protein